jgi:hypothetical protein
MVAAKWSALCAAPAFTCSGAMQTPAPSEQGTQSMALGTKELQYLNDEMTWREFADAAGATVLLRGLARGSSKKIPTKKMRKLQGEVVLTMADAGGRAMVQDALKVIRSALAKNGPHVTDQVMTKDAKRAKVSKRLQKQVEVVIANRRAKAA